MQSDTITWSIHGSRRKQWAIRGVGSCPSRRAHAAAVAPPIDMPTSTTDASVPAGEDEGQAQSSGEGSGSEGGGGEAHTSKWLVGGERANGREEVGALSAESLVQMVKAPVELVQAALVLRVPPRLPRLRRERENRAAGRNQKQSEAIRESEGGARRGAIRSNQRERERREAWRGAALVSCGRGAASAKRQAPGARPRRLRRRAVP